MPKCWFTGGNDLAGKMKSKNEPSCHWWVSRIKPAICEPLRIRCTSAGMDFCSVPYGEKKNHCSLVIICFSTAVMHSTANLASINLMQVKFPQEVFLRWAGRWIFMLWIHNTYLTSHPPAGGTSAINHMMISAGFGDWSGAKWDGKGKATWMKASNDASLNLAGYIW